MSHLLRKRALTVAVVVGIVGAWAPASVFAHVEFEDAPATVAPNSDIALTLHVANEREASNFNVAVAMRLPEGWTGVSCETKPTWTCEISTVSERVEVHFDKDAGAAAAEDETFEFTLHSAATLGTATFPTLQTYDTGEEVGWIGDPGSENPSPVLEVADPATTTTESGATTTAAAATTTAGAATTLAPTTTGTPEATTPVEPTTTALTAEAPGDTVTILDTTVTTTADSSSDDDANTGLILAIALVVAAAVAGTVMYLRRRKPPVPPTDPSAPGTGTPGVTGSTGPDVGV